MTILNGNTLSQILFENIKTKMETKNKIINFACILIGSNHPNKIYVKNIKQKCEYVGIKFILIEFEKNISQNILINKLIELNNDNNISSYMIQMPIPDHINSEIILNSINKNKDIECYNSENISKIISNYECLYPPTVNGICEILNYYNLKTEGKNITIIGKSNIVGTPLSYILGNEHKYKGTITLCDKYTNNLKLHVENADILIVAAGKHHLINSSFNVKESSIIIDVGIHKIEDISKKSGYKIEGDVDFNYFKDKCSFITPVPGGVGPMTVYSLIFNVCKNANCL